MKKLSFLICLLILVAFNSKAQVPGSGSRRTFFTTASTTNTFTVPAGVTMLYFEACSAGGGRGGRFMNTAADYKWGGGGGGGGFVRGYINVTAGQILTATVGSGGANGSDGSPTSTPAMAGNPGENTSLNLAGSVILTINGGQGGMGGSAYAGGTAGVGGMMAFYNTTYCMLTDSYGGFGGYPGISTATALGDYSGVGGTTGRLGQFNYLFQFLHFIEPASTGQSMYYLAPYLGTGAGRGTPSTGGYVYIYY